ncbi:hypothetical protein D3C84_1058110 [compost metagenome]
MYTDSLQTIVSSSLSLRFGEKNGSGTSSSVTPKIRVAREKRSQAGNCEEKFALNVFRLKMCNANCSTRRAVVLPVPFGPTRTLTFLRSSK